MCTGEKFPDSSSRSRIKPGECRPRVTLLPLKAESCFPTVKEGYKAEKVKDKTLPLLIAESNKEDVWKDQFSVICATRNRPRIFVFTKCQCKCSLTNSVWCCEIWTTDEWGRLVKGLVCKLSWKELGLLFPHFTFNIFSDYKKHMPIVKRRKFNLIIQSNHCS